MFRHQAERALPTSPSVEELRAKSAPLRHPATVLVVDDDEDAVDTMREILSEEGHVVLCASNGRQALELVHERHPNLVLLDLNMPELDGRGFIDAVRRETSLPPMRIIVLSGAEDTSGLESWEVVHKPLRLDTLLGLIDRAAQMP